MTDFRVEVKGAGLAGRTLARFNTNLRRELEGIVKSALVEGTNLAQQYAPYKTGALSRSITYRQNGLKGWYGPDPVTVVAKVQESGSDPYVIRPKNAKVLAFEGKDGNTVFAREVKHPGVKGSFYLKRSRQAVEPQFRRESRQAVRRALRPR